MKTLLAAAALTLGFATNGVAAIADLLNRGTFVTDTTTGLDWLDLNATMGMRFDVLEPQLTTSTSDFFGWRHASTAEAQGLFTTFGIPNTVGGFPSPAAGFEPGATINAGTVAFTTWMGKPDPINGPFAYGTVAESPAGSTSLYWLGATQRGGDTQWRGAITGDCCSLAIDGASSRVGHFLVRETLAPVPLPAAAWLLLSGLGGLAAFARKSRRKAEAAT